MEKTEHRGRRPLNGTVPVNILEFEYSYSYDCKKYFNLCVADANTLIFASGNWISFMNVTEKRVWFKRSVTGGGIGHIVKNPCFDHIAVAENGIEPPIIIYSWPTMGTVCVLHGGTIKRYIHLSYSSSGKLLASQSGEPDFLITVWNWREASIILQCKSYGQEVYNVSFARELPDRLVSAGMGHIKFWRMAHTFTGLKLKSMIGKFGKTEMSDIIAVYAMQDDTVLSGCEWGNMLLWEENLIKVEVCRKNRQTAHERCIVQFEYINGELFSVGMDGWIRVWFYETVEQSSPMNGECFLEIQPIYELYVSESGTEGKNEGSMLMCMQKQEPNNPESMMWYVQDANGALWLVNLSTMKKPMPAKRLFSCHAGPIIDMAASDWGPYIASLDITGLLHIYNITTRNLIIRHKFHDIGSNLLWLPISVDPSGCSLVCAFSSGVLRTVMISLEEKELKLLQAIKPHTEPIITLSLSPKCDLLVTGSTDCTVFMFKVCSDDDYVVLLPIGYMRMPSAPCCLTWKPEAETIFLGCVFGHCAEIDLSTIDERKFSGSYELRNVAIRGFKFTSVKSKLNGKAEERKRDAEAEADMQNRNEKQASLLMSGNHRVVPNRLLYVEYYQANVLWLFMATYDTSYIYEYPTPCSEGFESLQPAKRIDILDADDTEVQCCLFYKKRKYLFLGMENGEMVLSYDGRFLFTCAQDGNLFSFRINDDIPHEIVQAPKRTTMSLPEKDAEDIEELNHPSLEEVIANAEKNKNFAVANERKNKVLKIVYSFAEEYSRIMERNFSLPQLQRLKDVSLDLRITADLKEQMALQINLVHQKLTYKVQKSKLGLYKFLDHFVESTTCLPFAVQKILKPECAVYSLRGQKLEHILPHMRLDKMERNTAEAETQLKDHVATLKKSPDKWLSEEVIDKANVRVSIKRELHELMTVLQIEGVSSALKMQMNQLLHKYQSILDRLIEREAKWKAMNARKPKVEIDNPENLTLIEIATKTIREHRLKSLSNIEVLMREADTTSSKYNQLMACRYELHKLREDFNDSLMILKARKLEIRSEVLQFIEELKKIHAEIPEKHVKPLPMIPALAINIEFPENNLEMEKYTSMVEQAKQTKQYRGSLVVDSSCIPQDEEYGILSLYKKAQDEEREFLSTGVEIPMEQLKMLNLLNNIDHQETTWEREIKRRRVLHRIYQQDCILEEVYAKYKYLDKCLDDMEEERMYILEQSSSMDLFLLTLYQELLILSDSKAEENLLRDKLGSKEREQEMIKEKIKIATVESEHKEKKISKAQAEIAVLTSEFMYLTNESKCQKILQKIYKKKQMATKQDDKSTGSESSSESNTGDSERTDMDYFQLEENTCPPGCEKNLYDATLNMRNQRYNCERIIKDGQKDIEVLRKEAEVYSKKFRTMDEEIKLNKAELVAFMLQKQRKLNDIDLTVILKFHQLQHSLETGATLQLQDCVLFDREKLSNLYQKVEKLQEETLQLKETHKSEETHLWRIKLDIMYMKAENKKLRTKIREDTEKKFGREVSLDTLYQTMLCQMAHKIRSNISYIQKSFNEQIREIKKECNKVSKVLKDLLQDNTKKFSFLMVLEIERRRLEKILKCPLLSEEKMAREELEDKQELEKLQRILHNQAYQRKLFEEDIGKLHLKSTKLPRVFFRKPLVLKKLSFAKLLISPMRMYWLQDCNTIPRKMQLILVTTTILLITEDVWAVDYYADLYNNIDVDAILRSNRLTEQYIKCLLDKGPCTADGRQLK
ncbi:hypothetical protein KM043_013850, partial [Ampulex compressa]